MAVQTQISIEEYLRTSYRPDCEYIDGELLERNMGKREHARVQVFLAAWFFNHEREWEVSCYTEWRTQVSSTHVRIPDVALVQTGLRSAVLENAPVLIVEILSPADTYTEMKTRVADYQHMGAQTIWIIDPETRSGQMCEGDTWTQAAILSVTGTPIYVELEQLFRSVDES